MSATKPDRSKPIKPKGPFLRILILCFTWMGLLLPLSAAHAGSASAFGINDPLADRMIDSCGTNTEDWAKALFARSIGQDDINYASQDISQQLNSALQHRNDSEAELSAFISNITIYNSSYAREVVPKTNFICWLNVIKSERGSTVSVSKPSVPQPNPEVQAADPTELTPAQLRQMRDDEATFIAARSTIIEVLSEPSEKVVKNTGTYDQDDEGEDMTHCVQWHPSVSPHHDGNLANFCQPPTQVEIAWCTVGLDCGKNSGNMKTLGPTGQPSGSVAVRGTEAKKMGQLSQVQVRYAACKGKNTIHVISVKDDGFKFYCSKALK